MRRATAEMIHQSARASPGGLRNALCLERQRSELVTAPDFSPQASAGSRISACRAVSVAAVQSETTSNSQFCMAAWAKSASGRLTAGLVPIIHRAFIRPACSALNRSMAFKPGPRAMRGERQKRCTRSLSAALKSICAASVEARPPTSRPPMALGCPVIEKAPRPGLPIRPVARWALIMLLTLSTPLDDWLMPIENRLTTFSVSANNR